jgi:ribonuclease HI
VDETGTDLIPIYKDLLKDMNLKTVSLPKGRRTVIVSKFNDVVSQQNNGAELLAMVASLRIAHYKKGVFDKIFSDSDLIVKWWSKRLDNKKRERMDPKKVEYIVEMINLRKEYEGEIVKIPGKVNLADLGYHK